MSTPAPRRIDFIRRFSSSSCRSRRISEISLEYDKGVRGGLSRTSPSIVPFGDFVFEISGLNPVSNARGEDGHGEGDGKIVDSSEPPSWDYQTECDCDS
jgi:hypothetical protein